MLTLVKPSADKAHLDHVGVGVPLSDSTTTPIGRAAASQHIVHIPVHQPESDKCRERHLYEGPDGPLHDACTHVSKLFQAL